MKNRSLWLVSCVLVVLLFASCRQKTVRTIDKSDVERYYLAADTSKGALSIELNVAIPVCFEDDKVLDSIRNTIVSNLFGLEYVKFDNDSLVKRFTDDLKTEYKLTNGPILDEMDEKSLYSFNNEHVLDGFSLLSDEIIFSYGINGYVFMGCSHGLVTIYYLNFNLKNGKLITESDLFMKNSTKKLTELIKKRTVEQSREDESLEPIKNLEKPDYWIDAIKPNGNFYITDESLNYVFNPYEIGPYYLGITEVRIPYERLKNILKPNSIVGYLIKKGKTNKVN